MTLFASKGRGRPRKQGVPRDPKTGRIASGHDRQSPEAIKATAEEARIRQLLGVDTFLKGQRDERAMAAARKRVSNPLLGSALGRFHFAKELDGSQYDAGLWFAELYRDISMINGAPSPNMRALDYGAIPGKSTSPDKSDEWVARRKRQWMDVHQALYDANGDQGRTTAPIMEILKRTLVEDIGPLNAYELGNLRVGLNAINQARGL